MRKKDIIQLGITGVMAVVLVFLIGSLPKGTVKKAASLKESKTMHAIPEVGSNQDKGLYALLEKKARSLEYKRDPFYISAPALPPEEKTFQLILSGISWDSQNPNAIVNDQIIKKGSVIEECTVIDIQEDRIIVNDGTRDTTIMLGQQKTFPKGE